MSNWLSYYSVIVRLKQKSHEKIVWLHIGYTIKLFHIQKWCHSAEKMIKYHFWEARNVIPSCFFKLFAFIKTKMVPQLTLPNKTIKYCFVRGNQGPRNFVKKFRPFKVFQFRCSFFITNKNGAATRNWTKDTGIFSPLLYQLSYCGTHLLNLSLELVEQALLFSFCSVSLHLGAIAAHIY